MARNKLLTESQVRQFMKLANLAPLSDNYIRQEGYGMVPGARDEEDVDVAMADVEVGPEDEDLDLDVAMADEPLEEPEADLGMEDEGRMVPLDAFLDALEQAVEEVTGEETAAEFVDVEEPPAEEEEFEAEIAEVPGGGEFGEVEAEEELALESLSEEAIVQEVARRVAARLKRGERQEQTAEALAERIFDRLTQK